MSALTTSGDKSPEISAQRLGSAFLPGYFLTSMDGRLASQVLVASNTTDIEIEI